MNYLATLSRPSFSVGRRENVADRKGDPHCCLFACLCRMNLKTRCDSSTKKTPIACADFETQGKREERRGCSNRCWNLSRSSQDGTLCVDDYRHDDRLRQ